MSGSPGVIQVSCLSFNPKCFSVFITHNKTFFQVTVIISKLPNRLTKHTLPSSIFDQNQNLRGSSSKVVDNPFSSESQCRASESLGRTPFNIRTSTKYTGFMKKWAGELRLTHTTFTELDILVESVENYRGSMNV